MSLQIAIIFGSLMCAAAAGLFFVVIRTSMVHHGRLEGLSESLADAIEHLSETSSRPAPDEPGLLERVEEVERRMEKIHKECLSYLQRGSAAEQRAEQLRAERDVDEPEMTQAEALALINDPPESASPGPRRMTLDELESINVNGGN